MVSDSDGWPIRCFTKSPHKSPQPKAWTTRPPSCPLSARSAISWLALPPAQTSAMPAPAGPRLRRNARCTLGLGPCLVWSCAGAAPGLMPLTKTTATATATTTVSDSKRSHVPCAGEGFRQAAPDCGLVGSSQAVACGHGDAGNGRVRLNPRAVARPSPAAPLPQSTARREATRPRLDTACRTTSPAQSMCTPVVSIRRQCLGSVAVLHQATSGQGFQHCRGRL